MQYLMAVVQKQQSSHICRALLVAFISVGLWISPRISRAHIS